MIYVTACNVAFLGDVIIFYSSIAVLSFTDHLALCKVSYLVMTPTDIDTHAHAQTDINIRTRIQYSLARKMKGHNLHFFGRNEDQQ